jgi:hypothetical protein
MSDKGVNNIMNVVYTDNMSNIIIKGVPDDIYRRFKAQCAMEGKTVKNKLIEMIKKEVEQQK